VQHIDSFNKTHELVRSFNLSTDEKAFVEKYKPTDDLFSILESDAVSPVKHGLLVLALYDYVHTQEGSQFENVWSTCLSNAARYFYSIASRKNKRALWRATNSNNAEEIVKILSQELPSLKELLKEHDEQWYPDKRKQTWLNFFSSSQPSFELLKSKLYQLGEEEALLGSVQEIGEELIAAKQSFYILLKQLNELDSEADIDKKEKLKKLFQQIIDAVNQMGVVDWSEFIKLTKPPEGNSILENFNEILVKIRHGVEKLKSGETPFSILEQLFFYYDCLGITDTFYLNLCSEIRGKKFPETFDREYIKKRLLQHYRNGLYRNLAHSQLSPALFQLAYYQFLARYEQIESSPQQFFSDLQKFYDRVLEKINATNLASWIEHYFSTKNTVSGEFNLTHRGLELFDVQNKFFSLMEIHYSDISSGFRNHERLLELRDEVFDYCNPATAHLRKENNEERMQAFLDAAYRFITYASEEYNDARFNTFLDDIFADKRLLSYFSGLNLEINTNNETRVTALLDGLRQWIPGQDRKKEKRGAEQEKEKEKGEIEEEEDISEDISEEKGKEKNEKAENSQSSDPQLASEYSPADPRVIKKVNLILFGKDTFSSLADPEPAKGRNYLYWMRDRASFSVRLQHIKHGAAGILRARALLHRINQSAISSEYLWKEIKKAYDESRDRKHSLSRYLKAGLNDLPLELILALRDEDFHKIRGQLMHCALSTDQVAFLSSEAKHSASSLTIFNRSKKKPVMNENEVQARNKISASVSDKERYIAALEYIAAYPRNEIAKQLLSTIQSATQKKGHSHSK